MVVSHEAKKEQRKLSKTQSAMNYYESFTRLNIFVIQRYEHNQSISLDSHQLLNPHCRHTILLPTLTNTPKAKAIS